MLVGSVDSFDNYRDKYNGGSRNRDNNGDGRVGDNKRAGHRRCAVVPG